MHEGGGAWWVEEQHTRNWPNCNDHHESAHQNDYLEPKKWRDTTKKNSCASRRIGAPTFAPNRRPLSHFQIRSDATERKAGKLALTVVLDKK